MNLHENIKLFKQAIQFTAKELGLPEIYVEKDYWVTLALHTIFTSDVRDSVIFKGGTSLAKCFSLIDRFSEDIDLVILRDSSDTGNQLKSKLKKISTIVGNIIPEIHIEGITNKMGMIRKTAHNYNKVFEGEFKQVRSDIIIESTWLGYFEPYTTANVSTYIYDMMLTTSQNELVEKYGLIPFSVKVLDPKRTMCEKIMSLVRFSHTKKPILDLNNKIRHIYDIHKMLENAELNDFLASDNFETMILKVANDDTESFKNNNNWLNLHPKKAILFDSPEIVWNQLENTYNTSFKAMVYGDLPSKSDILQTIKKVAQRIEKLKWNIQV
jgi:hypothetical protein